MNKTQLKRHEAIERRLAKARATVQVEAKPTKSDLYTYSYQAFVQTKWLGPTNHKCARVRATNVSSGATVVVSWDHGLNVSENHIAAARALLTKCDQPQPDGFLMCGTKDQTGYILTGVRK
jgi:hypothetical protein